MLHKNLAILLATYFFFAPSCATSSETASADTMTANVGTYAPPPSGMARVRVGVPDFEVERGVTADVSKVAADQLTTLGTRTRRFIMIERAQLGQLLEEQGLSGVVRAAEIAKKGNVRGVDYLLLGKVTNLRVKAERSGSNFGLGRLPIPGTRNTLGAFDFSKKNSTIKVDCGVDLRLVNASTGEIAAADFAEYSRTDSVGAFGLQILGVNAGSDADLRIDTNNRGKILRLALDHALRKMLPMVDDYLVNAAAAKKQD